MADEPGTALDAAASVRPRWLGALGMSLAGVLLGLGYGIAARFAFDTPTAAQPEALRSAFVAMSVAFLFVVPFALGVLTAALAPKDLGLPWLYWLLMPLLPATLLMVTAMALAWEGALCIVMAAPIFLGMAFAGGLLVALIVTFTSRRPRGSVVASCLIAPFVLAPLEARLPQAPELRLVETTIVVRADAATLWRHVARVDPIGRHELPDGLFQSIGIPRPLAATLSRDGLGALREASFEGGILFHETVTEWVPEQALGFDIRVDAASVSPQVLDRHVRVGGEYFDVLHGRFVFEPLEDGRIRLRLSSQHRLQTRFNVYSGLWTDAIMRDIQQNICEVIRRRAEDDARNQAAS